MRAADFIENQYKKIRLLKKSERGEVWLTTDQQGKLAIYRQSQQPTLPLSELKTANISLLPQIYYIASDNSGTTCIEEYIHGQSLADRKKMQNFLTEREARKILLALSHGLAKLHDLGIIHRDIKPEHILIEKDGTPRLIDFDTCRRFKDGKAEDTTLLGTKTYAPPEQFGFQQTDQRSDIYSLGVTISELLPPNYQGTLRPILNRCSRLDPADRYQSMQELKTAIQMSALNNRIALLLIPPVLTLLTAYFYPFSSQQPEPTPANTTEETAPAQLENINTTQASPVDEAIKPPAPATVPHTTVTATEPPSSPPVAATPRVPAPTTKSTNYIRVQYFWHGRYINEWMENFDTDIDNAGTAIKLPRQCWAAQDNPQGIIHLAPNDTVNIRIRNQSAQPWNNAHAILHYNSNGQTSTKNLPISALSPDETIDLNIPLNQYTIANPKKVTNQTIGQLTIEVKSDAPQKIRCSRYYFNFICLP